MRTLLVVALALAASAAVSADPISCSCTCNGGFSYVSDNTGCVNVDACNTSPCNAGTQGGSVTCTDLPPPAGTGPDGRTCTCSAGYRYQDDTAGCVSEHVDACLANPCNNGAGGRANCTDLPAPAPNSPEGRTCTCNDGWLYANDTAGCVPPPARCSVQIRAQGTQGLAVYVMTVGVGRYVPILWNTVGVPDLIEIFVGTGTTGTRVARYLAGSGYRCFPNDGTLVATDSRALLDMSQFPEANGVLTARITSPCIGTAWYFSAGCATDSIAAANAFQWPRVLFP